MSNLQDVITRMAFPKSGEDGKWIEKDITDWEYAMSDLIFRDLGLRYNKPVEIMRIVQGFLFVHDTLEAERGRDQLDVRLYRALIDVNKGGDRVLGIMLLVPEGMIDLKGNITDKGWLFLKQHRHNVNKILN